MTTRPRTRARKKDTVADASGNLAVRLARPDFAAAVTAVTRTAGNHTNPVLSGVLLEAAPETGKVTISAFDYDAYARWELVAAVESPGRVLVSGRLLAAIVKVLPSAPPVKITVEGSSVALHCGSAQFTLPALPVEDYPDLPVMPPCIGEVSAGTLAEAVAQVARIASTDHTLPQLTGVRIEAQAGALVLVATDRFRLFVREIPWQPTLTDGDELELLVPAKVITEVAKTLTSDDGPVRLHGDSQRFGLTVGDRQVAISTLAVEFPRWRQLLPAADTFAATVDVPVGELAAAVKRANVFGDRATGTDLEIGPDGIRVIAQAEAGGAREQVEARCTGQELTVRIKAAYLLDALTTLHAPQARLSLISSTRPGVIQPLTPTGEVVDDHRHLVMPIRPQVSE